jgi:hypothetical protein
MSNTDPGRAAFEEVVRQELIRRVSQELVRRFSLNAAPNLIGAVVTGLFAVYGSPEWHQAIVWGLAVVAFTMFCGECFRLRHGLHALYKMV